MFLADAGSLISSAKVLETTRESSLSGFLVLFQCVGNAVVSLRVSITSVTKTRFKLVVEIGFAYAHQNSWFNR